MTAESRYQRSISVISADNMIILDYRKKNHKQIISSCVKALKEGKAVAYPTDTSYGLAVDATNSEAIKKLYEIKERESGRPVHVIVPSVAYAKRVAKWNRMAEKLARKFWPGPLTMVLGLRASPLAKAAEDKKGQGLRILSAGTGFIGLRYPDKKIALDLAKYLKRPITTTSANPPSHAGGDDTYSAEEIVRDFKPKKHRPDIIINAGKLPRRKPSTFVKIDGENISILREGPISGKQVRKALEN